MNRSSVRSLLIIISVCVSSILLMNAGSLTVAQGTPLVAPIETAQIEDGGAIQNLQMKETETGVVVTWETLNPTNGWIEYGTSPDNLQNLAYDLRGQDLTDTQHTIELPQTESGSVYYFVIVSNGLPYDNQGVPFKTDLGIEHFLDERVSDPFKGVDDFTLHESITETIEFTGLDHLESDTERLQGTMEGEDITSSIVETTSHNLYQTPITTTTWAEYQDPQFGFSFSYPQHWIMQEGHIVDLSVPIWEVRVVAPYNYYAAIVVAVRPVQSNVKNIDDLSEYLRPLEQATPKETTVAGHQALLFENDHSKAVYFTTENLLYQLSLQEYGDVPEHQDLSDFALGLHEENREIFEQILTNISINPDAVALQPESPGNIVSPDSPDDDAESFRKPLDDGSEIFAYADHPTFWNYYSPCFGTNIQNTFHLAEDWKAPAGTPVKAVADGVVDWYNANHSTWPGRVVIVKHTVPGEGIIYSFYGHLDQVFVAANPERQEVKKGDIIGTILYQTFNGLDNSHVHWEMRSLSEGPYPCSWVGHVGKGYHYPEHPNQLGFRDPTDYVNSHQGNVNCTPGANGVVLYEHGNHAGRCITLTGDDSDFNDNNFNDIASSLRFVGSYYGRWEVRLYEDANYHGAMSRFFYNNRNLSNTYIGNDRASSVRMWEDGDDERTIFSDQVLNGNINRGIDKDHYYFYGNSGQVVSFTMNATSSTLDPHLYLVTPSNVFLTQDDDGGPGHDSLLQITLPETGMYRIYAKSYADSSTGPYTLTLQLRNNSQCNIGVHGAVLYEHVNFDIGGRCITLTQNDASLFDNGFNNIASAIRFVGFYTSYGEAVLFDYGWYKGDWSNFIDDDNDIGDRLINHDRTSSFLLWIDRDDGRVFDPGATLSGSLKYWADLDDYFFAGSAGQQVTINLNATSSGLDTYLVLFRPDGSFLTSDDDGGDTGFDSRIQITLPETGVYTVFAESYARQSSGSYTISLTSP